MAETFDTKDKKPPLEQKDEAKAGREWFDDDKAGQAPRAASVDAAKEQTTPADTTPNAGDDVAANGDAKTIASPDVFLVDRHRELMGQGIVIRQVWADAEDRGYVIVHGKKIGYFELHEGMPRAEAEKALNGAYDGTAAVL